MANHDGRFCARGERTLDFAERVDYQVAEYSWEILLYRMEDFLRNAFDQTVFCTHRLFEWIAGRLPSKVGLDSVPYAILTIITVAPLHLYKHKAKTGC